jgi:hypothetical protein
MISFALSLRKPFKTTDMQNNLKPIEPTKLDVALMFIAALIVGVMLNCSMFAIFDLLNK